jgi:CRP/FNR family cyclic AMP-dependent transcriptional regulator
MCILVRTALLDILDPADRAALVAGGRRRDFAPGEFLIAEGDKKTGVLLLLAGWVKVAGNSADGREVLLSFRTSGDAVGELAALDNEQRSASVIAVTKVSAVLITQEHFLSVMAARPGAALALSRSIAAKMRLITHHRIEVGGAPARQRLARVLLYLVDSYATLAPEGWRIDVPLTRDELATLVGASTPSMFRELRYLRDRGALITWRRWYFVTNLDLLQKVAQGDPAEDYGGDKDPTLRKAII